MVKFKDDGSAWMKAVNRPSAEEARINGLFRKAPADRACRLAADLKATWKGIPGVRIENRGKVIFIRLDGDVIGEFQVSQEVA